MSIQKSTITELINSIKSGIFNLPENEKETLINDTCNYLSNISTNPGKNELHKLIELFRLLESPELRELAAEKIEPDVFFSLGKKLVNIKNENLIQGFFEIFRSSYFLKKIVTIQ